MGNGNKVGSGSMGGRQVGSTEAFRIVDGVFESQSKAVEALSVVVWMVVVGSKERRHTYGRMKGVILCEFGEGKQG